MKDQRQQKNWHSWSSLRSYHSNELVKAILTNALFARTAVSATKRLSSNKARGDVYAGFIEVFCSEHLSDATLMCRPTGWIRLSAAIELEIFHYDRCLSSITCAR